SVAAEHWLHPYACLAHGMVEYRGGNYASALSWLQRCQSTPTTGLGHIHRGHAGIFEAMSYQQLKQHKQAGVAFAKAVRLIEADVREVQEGKGRHDWFDPVVCAVAIREARELGLGP